MRFISPSWISRFPALICAQSTRQNGFSKENFSELNLGLSSGDDVEIVKKNRETFFNLLGIKQENVALSKQIHGDQVLITEKPGIYENFDSIISIEKGVFAAISVADCTPVLIYDEKNGFCAAVHAGWRGTAAQITAKTIKELLKLGSAPQHLHAFIGACIGRNCFEVGKEVAELFESEFVSNATSPDKFLIDLKEANKKQLMKFDIPENNIEVSSYCTFTHNDLFYSYRKQNGITGRMIGIIGLKE